MLVGIFEAQQLTDYKWFEPILWPFKSLGWFRILPGPGIILFVLVCVTLSLAYFSKSRKSFFALLTATCFYWVGWCWMVWQFHD
jgi:hypothetical protein